MKKKLIVLIDDDPDEFDFLLNALSKIPDMYDCSFAVNAEEAAMAMREHVADYIFVDMNMPAVNGLECLERLKRNERFSNVPTYIYTTCFNITVANKAKELGAEGCLRKPTNAKALSDLLKQLYVDGRISATPGMNI